MDLRREHLVNGGPAGGSLDSWLDDHQALTASIRAGSRGLEAGLGGFLANYAIVRAERLAGAVLDRSGRLLFANKAFVQLFGQAPPEPETALSALERRRVCFTTPSAEDNAVRPSALVYAPIDQARGWAMPTDVRAALDRPGGAILGLAVAGIGGGDALDDACRAFGLTPLQTRIAAGLVRTGHVRGAAREAGVSYQTARSVTADTMRRVGATRLSSLIERLVRLSFGVWPEGRDSAAVLSDVWGLSTRQATLALRLAEGRTRAQAAVASGISEATAKKDIDAAFATLGVRTAAALSRAVTETRALALLTEATHHDSTLGNDFLEPLGLFSRADGSQVAYSDYGPRSGAPVLVVHSSSASRPAPMALVRALQAAGFRPLAIDRPGFGLTDSMPDREAHRADPFAGACPDIVGLCERLNLSRVDVIGRGGAQVVVALARRRPDLVGRVVLVNPDPPTLAATGRTGVLAAVKEAFIRRPDLIESLARFWVSNLGRGQVARIMTGVIAGSAPDEAVMRDPRNLADYGRGYRMFLTGRLAGYVDEQTALTRWSMEPLPGLTHWRAMFGAQDPMHTGGEAQAFWRAVLPDTPVDVVEGAGRFLVISHADQVVAALRAAAPPPPPVSDAAGSSA